MVALAFDASTYKPANDVDWGPLIQPVAEKLLGPPNPRLTRGSNWRYGTNGSLSVDVERGLWADHEHNRGGGVLQLIVERNGGSLADAVLWLRSEGLLGDAPRHRQSSETYDYQNEAGQPLYRIERKYPKDFRQSVWDASRSEFRCFTGCMEGVRRVPYRLPELLASASDDTVFVVEGERCCERLRDLGFVATTNAAGAKKWGCGWGAEYFTGRRVVILPDNDQAGRDHEKIVRADLEGHAAAVATLILPGLPDKGDIIDWLNAGGTAGELRELAMATLAKVQTAEHKRDEAAAPFGIAAEQYIWTSPSDIPLRPWVYGHQWLRGSVGLVVAPGATGKTALLVGHALALVTGRNLLGPQVWEGPRRVWLWNLEDSKDEMRRLVQAAAIHHGIAPEDVDGRLFLNSGLDGPGLVITHRVGKDFEIRRPIVEALVHELKAKQIDVLIVDPFISCHTVPENDNGAMDMVAKEWARVAVAANCCVVLAHHTGKLGDAAASAEKARGASAIVAAARSVHALNRMNDAEADHWGIHPNEARRYIKTYDDKNNRAPPAASCQWYYLRSVRLNNGGIEGGDAIQVVVPWAPPMLQVSNVPEAVQEQALSVLAAGHYRANEQAAEWAGKVLAPILGISLDTKRGRREMKRQLQAWETAGRVRVVDAKDARSKSVKFYEVVVISPPLHHEVEASGEAEGSPITTTAPC